MQKKYKFSTRRKFLWVNFILLQYRQWEQYITLNDHSVVNDISFCTFLFIHPVCTRNTTRENPTWSLIRNCIGKLHAMFYVHFRRTVYINYRLIQRLLGTYTQCIDRERSFFFLLWLKRKLVWFFLVSKSLSYIAMWNPFDSKHLIMFCSTGITPGTK